MSESFKRALQAVSGGLKAFFRRPSDRGWRAGFLTICAGLLLVCVALAQAPAPVPQPSAAATTPALPEPPLPPLSESNVPAPVAPAPNSRANQTESPAEGPASPDTLPSSPSVASGATVQEEQPASPFNPPAARSAQAPALGEDAPLPPSSRPENEPLVTIGRPSSRIDYGEEGNRKATQLRTMPPERFTFDRAALRDVLRFLAEAAGIPYVSIPENSPQAQQLVTFRMTASPFAALESVARQNDIGLSCDQGVWFLEATDPAYQAQRVLANRVSKLEDENELVGVLYQLRYDSADSVDFRSDNAGSAQGAAQQTSAAGGAITTPNLPLQNSQKVFAHRIPRLVNDVRAIIGLPPLTADEDGNLVDSSSGGGRILDADSLKSGQGGESESEQP